VTESRDGLFMTAQGAEAEPQLSLGVSGKLRDLGSVLEVVDRLVIYICVLQHAPALISLAS
jgi:hypothetical protein